MLNNPGSLHNDASMTIHTIHALRLISGRRKTDTRQQIAGLNTFLGMTHHISLCAMRGDPYADWYMVRIENKADDVNIFIKQLKEQVETVFQKIPTSLTIGENISQEPITLSMMTYSPLGYMAIFILAEFDELVRQIILAQRLALIDRRTQGQWLGEAAHHLRSLFHLVMSYKFSGVNREDIAMNNAAAQAARHRLGDVPADILDGSLRSRFAIALRQLGEIPAEDEDINILVTDDEENHANL